HGRDGGRFKIAAAYFPTVPPTSKVLCESVQAQLCNIIAGQRSRRVQRPIIPKRHFVLPHHFANTIQPRDLLSHAISPPLGRFCCKISDCGRGVTRVPRGETYAARPKMVWIN